MSDDDPKRIIILCPTDAFPPFGHHHSHSADDIPSVQPPRLPLKRPTRRRRAKDEPGPPRKKIRKRRWRNRPEVAPPFKLDTIEDLLYIAWNYQGDVFDWFTLWSMIPALTELNRLVGMEKLKQGVIDLVVYYLQDLHIRRGPRGNDISDGDMLHTVLYGPPGTGKTTVAHILAKLYCKMGFLPTENVVVAKRSDLVGKWIGHSESKTTEILNSALGGVLFLDEVYSMGHSEKTDSFAKAAVDLINQFLSEHKGEMVCIIAGYEKELNECFFSINPGLERRFPWRFTIDSYTPKEMTEMFRRKVRKEGWNLFEGDSEKPPAVDVEFFTTNAVSFPFFGGDIDNFFTFCKTAHSRRIFGMKDVTKKLLIREDLERGFGMFTASQKKEEGIPDAVRSMFL